MKFSTKALFLYCLCTLIIPPTATTQAQQEYIQSSIQEIIKEKTHLKTEKSYKDGITVKNINLRSSEENKLTNNYLTSISEGEPMIAVDVNNTDYMSIAYMKSSNAGLEVPIYFSEDAGKTWKLSSFDIQKMLDRHVETQGGSLLGGGDPVLLYDNNNRLYFSWISFTIKSADLKLITWYAISDDHGKTFKLSNKTPFIAIGKLKNLQTGEVENYGNGIFDRQWLAIDRSDGPYRGTIYCSGLHLPRPDVNKFAGIGLTKKTPSADQFEEDIQIVNGDDFLQFANIDVDNTGNLHIIYASTNNEGIFHQVSIDGGNSFSAVHKIANNGYSRLGDNIIQSRENPMPMLAIDRSNNELFVSWTNYDNREAQAYYSSSTDNGNNWTNPISIGNFKSNNEQSFMPALSSNKKGDLSFSWFQIDKNNQAHFFNAVKEKELNTPHEPIVITSKFTQFLPYINRQDVFFGDYLNSVMVGCKTYSVFSDGRDNTGAKLYLGITDYCDEISSTYNIGLSVKSFDVKSIFPQPAKDHINIIIESQGNQNINVSWYQLEAKLLHKENSLNLQDGINEIKISIPKELQTGEIFYLQLSSGTTRIVKKISIM